MLKSALGFFGAVVGYYWSFVIQGFLLTLVEVWQLSTDKTRIPPSWHSYARYILLFLIVAGIFVAAVQAYHDLRVRVTELEDELSDRFEKAVANLGAESQAGRMLAITTISEIALRHERYRKTTLDVLTVRIRERSPAPMEPWREVRVQELGNGEKGVKVRQQWGEADIHKFAQTLSKVGSPAIDPDVRAMVDVICKVPKPDGYRVDLSQTDLSGVVFEDCILDRAMFTASTLRSAVFTGAQLRYARFEGAILNDANFTNAIAPYASFSFATAHRVHLDGADIRQGQFFGADLYDASIQRANAAEADFQGCQLWRLSAGEADLRNASFAGAMLEGADLSHALNLTAAQFNASNGPRIDKNTKLPKLN